MSQPVDSVLLIDKSKKDTSPSSRNAMMQHPGDGGGRTHLMQTQPARRQVHETLIRRTQSESYIIHDWPKPGWACAIAKTTGVATCVMSTSLALTAAITALSFDGDIRDKVDKSLP